MCTVSSQTFQAFNSPKEAWTSSRFLDQVPQTPQDRQFHLRCLAAASPGMVEPMAATNGQYSPRHSQWAFIGMDDDDFDTSNLHTRVIQSPLKDILLSTYRSPERFGPDSPLEATSLLADLGRLAPSLMKDFTPKHHAQSSFVFRLINDIDFRGEEDGYIAMSYCWKNVSRGPSKKTVTPLGELPWAWTKEVEQFLLPTSAAVFQAVLRERKIGEGLWFDQVCINQEDEREKVAAMGAMDSIYKNARTVVIALDDVAVPPEEERFLQPYIDQYALADWPLEQQPNTGASPPFMQQYPLLKSFIERILCSVWFERAWCAQEMKMGRSHVFILPCGSDYSGEEEGEQTVLRFDGNFFYHILSLANEVHFPTPTLHVRIRSLLKFFRERLSQHNNSNLAVRNIRSPVSPMGEKSITPIIAEVFQLEASGDPRLPEYLRRLDANRDRMCITLNAAGLPLALTASNPFSRPNIEAECIRSLLLVGLAARDPVALCTTGPPLQLHDGSVSWLCRPSSLDVNSNRLTPPKFHHNASQITQGSDGRAEFAQLDLIFLDLPHRTRPNPQYSQLVARARVFIDLCAQYQLDGSALWNFWQAPNNPRALAMRNIFIQTLACLFDLGPSWCLEVSLQMQQSNAPALDPQVIDMLLNPHLLIHNYLQLPDGQAAMSQLLTFVSSIIASGMPWSSGATERSYGPLIISAPNSTPNATLVSRAIIFAPFEHSKTLLIATPAAIKDMAYGSLARGWVLTSMNPYTGGAKPTVSWTLQAKGVIFGDGNFNATLASCGDADVRNHRVYGPSNVR